MGHQSLMMSQRYSCLSPNHLKTANQNLEKYMPKTDNEIILDQENEKAS